MEPPKRIVLWIDDDTVAPPFDMPGFDVRTAQSCSEAEALLDGGLEPSMIIVDAVLPQAGWGERLYEYPGVELARALRKRLGFGVPMAIFANLITEPKQQAARELGMVGAYWKNDTNVSDIIERIAEHENQPRGVSIE